MDADAIVVDVPEEPRICADRVMVKPVAVTKPTEHPLGKVAAVVLWGDGVAVVDADAQNLAMYDGAGHFTGALGTPGDGVGEFGPRLGNATWYGSRLAVLDHVNRRVAMVDRAGAMEHYQTPEAQGAVPGRLAATAEGELILASSVLGVDPTASSLPAQSTVFSRFRDSSWRECFTIDPPHPGNRVPAVGGRLLWTLNGAGHVVTSRRGEFAVQVHDDTGAVVRILQRGWHPLPLMEADGRIMVGAFDTLMQRSAEAVGRKIPALVLAGMRQLIDVPDCYPPFVTMLSDDVGRFWLELPAHATDIAQERPGQLADTNFGSGQWEVWDEAGSHLFDVRFPPPFVLMDVRGDLAAGVRRYAEGRPVVAVYRIVIA